MRRLFWLSVGAAAGYYAARRGAEAVEEARRRGLVGNVTLAVTTASKAAAAATRTSVAVGEVVGARARALADSRSGPAATADPARPDPSTPSREARP